MNCPKCNHIVKDTAKFCENCGAKIEVDNTTIECPSCHARIPADSKFCPDCGQNLQKEELCSLSLYPYYDTQSGLWGYKDREKHTILIDPKYSEVRKFSEGIAIVRQGEKLFAIDETGSEILTFPCHCSISSLSDCIDGHILYRNHQYHSDRIFNINGGIYTADKGIVIDSYSEGLYQIYNKNTEETGFIDGDGNLVVQWMDESAHSFHDGLARVMNNRHEYGYMDKTGKVVIPFGKYKYAEDFSCGMARVMTPAMECFFIDKFEHRFFESQILGHWFREDLNFILNEQNKKWAVCDKQGKLITSYKYDYIEDLDYGFSEGICCIYRSIGGKKKYGFVNSSGKEITPIKYDQYSTFRDGYAIVEEQGKYGLIDTNGNEIFKCICKGIYQCESGLYLIESENGMRFYVDADGNMAKHHYF